MLDGFARVSRYIGALLLENCFISPAVGAFVQWRAKAIGEKAAAAESKLEKAGPYEGMTVRRVMAIVLRVLKDVFEEDFCTDRLEMVCVDLGDTNEARGELALGAGEHGEHHLRSRVAEVLATPSALPKNACGDDNRRDSSRGGQEGEGHVRKNNGLSEGAAVLRHGVFRRVSKSEMDALLCVEGPAGSEDRTERGD